MACIEIGIIQEGGSRIAELEGNVAARVGGDALDVAWAGAKSETAERDGGFSGGHAVALGQTCVFM